MFLATLIIILGIALLIISARLLIKGSASLAHHLDIPPIVIGLSVVAFGTSAPELAVNLLAITGNQPTLATSTILGSNIANILLVLGLATIIKPLIFKKETVKKELPFIFFATGLLYLLANDSLLNGVITDRLGRIDGIILLVLFGFFLYYNYTIIATQRSKKHFEKKPWHISLLMAIAGIIGLALGGKLVVESAVDIAQAIGISERLIGLTVIAIGTSLPELLTTIIAARRKHVDLAIGNIIGSNIFNILWILGLSSTIRPLPFTKNNLLDVIVSITTTVLLMLLIFIGKKYELKRWQGFLFLAIYISYLIFIFTVSI